MIVLGSNACPGRSGMECSFFDSVTFTSIDPGEIAALLKLVDYRNSGWVTGDEGNVVAYAGVMIQ